MNKLRSARLAIGSAQFGLPYGIVNNLQIVDPKDVAKILRHAQDAGIHTIDTAINYGTSETVLGEIGINDWSVISKLPALPQERISISAWVFEKLQESLCRLKVPSIEGLLLHQPSDLLREDGNYLVQTLYQAKKNGLVRNIGISIYDPSDLDRLLNVMTPDIVQCPYNILDHRIVKSGWADKLAKKNIKIHVRSIFLQGILLANRNSRPKYFEKWNGLWGKWDSILLKNSLSPLQACINDVIFNDYFEKIIIGVNELAQLKEIILACNRNCEQISHDDISIEDVNLLHPSNWI